MQSDDDGAKLGLAAGLAKHRHGRSRFGRPGNRQGLDPGHHLHLAGLRDRYLPGRRRSSRGRKSLAARAAETLAGGSQAAPRRTAPQAELGCGCSAPPTAASVGPPAIASRSTARTAPIQLSDGRLLYAGKDTLDGRGGRTASASRADDGRSWTLAGRDARSGPATTAQYHELARRGNGRRPAGAPDPQSERANGGETLQSESSDGGKTWSVPHSIGVWGHPSHLLRLKDGRLLMTYGHRRPPFGNQARLSENGGRTWSEPITIISQTAAS